MTNLIAKSRNTIISVFALSYNRHAVAKMSNYNLLATLKPKLGGHSMFLTNVKLCKRHIDIRLMDFDEI